MEAMLVAATSTPANFGAKWPGVHNTPHNYRYLHLKRERPTATIQYVGVSGLPKLS